MLIKPNAIISAAMHAIKTSSMGFHGQLGGLAVGGSIPRAVVVTVTVTLCELVPSSVTEGCDGVHVAAVGAPEQLRLIVWLKLPSGDTLMV